MKRKDYVECLLSPFASACAGNSPNRGAALVADLDLPAPGAFCCRATGHSLAAQRLEELDLRDCGLSDSGVRELADGLPQLQSLNLEHCTKARRLP